MPYTPRIQLSYSIAEFEREEVGRLWEAPDIFSRIIEDGVWIIYGKKGSGKSTLVTYLNKTSAGSTPSTLIIRPHDTEIYTRILNLFDKLRDADPRVVEMHVSHAFATMVTLVLMRECVDVSGPLRPGSNEETIYSFLVANGLHQGSILRRAASAIADAAAKIGNLPDIKALFSAGGAVGFTAAEEALELHLLKLYSGTRLTVCIDDIDDVGFQFSALDRSFVNGLFMYVANANRHYSDRKVPVRVLLTCPSELYFHSELWGSDWISSHAECLRWRDPRPLRELVNKRIARALKIRKSNPRHVDDIYSVESASTWARLLPENIDNALGRPESAFDYLLRHTLYTPRQLLGLCDKILASPEFGRSGATEPTPPQARMSAQEWSTVFQRCTSEFSIEACRDFLNLFKKIYDGLPELMDYMSRRPHIWRQQQLLGYLGEYPGEVQRRDTRECFARGGLVGVLYNIGFLGFGIRLPTSPPGTQTYELSFSFLEQHPRRASWSLAVIAPMFYDEYQMQPVGSMIVQPHHPLVLPTKADNALADYDAEKNIIRY